MPRKICSQNATSLQGRQVQINIVPKELIEVRGSSGLVTNVTVSGGSCTVYVRIRCKTRMDGAVSDHEIPFTLPQFNRHFEVSPDGAS